MNRWAVVTGATSGIGAAYAELLAGKGYHLLISGRREKKIQDIASTLTNTFGVKVRVVLCEFQEESQLNHLLDQIADLGSVDVLVNNAGYGLGSTFGGNLFEHLGMVKVHVIAAMSIMHAVLPGMIQQKFGKIINVSSMASFFPVSSGSTYAATKAFLNTFSQAMYMELRRYGIEVQALCPGMTRSDFHDTMGDKGEEIRKRYPFSWMEPQKVAALSMKHTKKVIYVPGIVNKMIVFIITKIPKPIYYKLVSLVMK